MGKRTAAAAVTIAATAGVAYGVVKVSKKLLGHDSKLPIVSRRVDTSPATASYNSPSKPAASYNYHSQAAPTSYSSPPQDFRSKAAGWGNPYNSYSLDVLYDYDNNR